MNFSERVDVILESLGEIIAYHAAPLEHVPQILHYGLIPGASEGFSTHLTPLAIKNKQFKSPGVYLGTSMYYVEGYINDQGPGAIFQVRIKKERAEHDDDMLLRTPYTDWPTKWDHATWNSPVAGLSTFSSQDIDARTVIKQFGLNRLISIGVNTYVEYFRHDLEIDQKVIATTIPFIKDYLQALLIHMRNKNYIPTNDDYFFVREETLWPKFDRLRKKLRGATKLHGQMRGQLLYRGIIAPKDFICCVYRGYIPNGLLSTIESLEDYHSHRRNPTVHGASSGASSGSSIAAILHGVPESDMIGYINDADVCKVVSPSQLASFIKLAHPQLQKIRTNRLKYY